MRLDLKYQYPGVTHGLRESGISGLGCRRTEEVLRAPAAHGVSKLCVRIKGTFSFSLSKNWDNFSRTGPFLMYNSGNESYGHAASYAFGFIKKYLFFEKLEPKTFCDMFFITRFSEGEFFIFSNRKF